MSNNKNYKFPCQIGKIPFIYNINDSMNNHDGIPNLLSFSLSMDNETGLMYQEKNLTTEKYLNMVYKIGSKITGHMDDYDFGKLYSNDFIEFVLSSETELKDKSILEIGCGTGYLLNELKKQGANVIGIEPGEENHKAKLKYDIEIISDFFPSEKISSKFDIIIFYNVLEHIEDLEFFLLNVRKQLKQGGKIYFGVPDCEKAIENGDISMLIHEHIYYFTKDTLKNTINKILKTEPKIEKSNYGSELNGMISFENENLEFEVLMDDLIFKNFEYLRKMNILLMSFKNFFIECSKNNYSIGIYVPSRIINSLALLFDSVDLKKIRFYDDDIKMYDKHFPGFDIKIKNRQFLVEEPPNFLLIMSYSFSNQIYKNVANELPLTTSILFIEDFIEGGKYESIADRN